MRSREAVVIILLLLVVSVEVVDRSGKKRCKLVQSRQGLFLSCTSSKRTIRSKPPPEQPKQIRRRRVKFNPVIKCEEKSTPWTKQNNAMASLSNLNMRCPEIMFLNGMNFKTNKTHFQVDYSCCGFS